MTKQRIRAGRRDLMLLSALLLTAGLLAVLVRSQSESGQLYNAGLERLRAQQYLAEPGEKGDQESIELMSRDTYWQTRYTYPTGRADRKWLLDALQWDRASVRSGTPAGRVTYGGENNQSPLALNPNRWTNIGPSPQESNTCQAPCFIFGEVAGRTNDIVIDPVSPTIAYLASDGGGVWKTTNCCSAATLWFTTTEGPLISTVAIGDISIDPTNHNTVYAGTGDHRFGSFSFGSSGILKSTNQGATWTVKGADVFGPYYPQPQGQFPQYNSVSKVEADPRNGSTVVAGSKTGLFISYDGGDEWAGPCYPDPFPAQRQDITSVILRDNGVSTDMYVAVGARGYSTTVQYNLAENGANGIYRATVPSSGCPANWTLLSRPDNGWPVGTGSGVPVYQTGGNVLGRVDMAMAPSNHNYIYAEVQAINPGFGAIQRGGLLGIWRTTDGGLTWEQRTTAQDLEDAQDLCGGLCTGGDLLGVCGDLTQNWYDQNIVVDPNNPDVIFFDNINIWKSTDGGTTVRDLTCGYSTLDVPRPVHVDQHALTYLPGSSSVLMAGSDGGAYVTLNANTAQPSFNNLNGTLNTIEFYSGDITGNFANSPNPGANAGAQDNGSSVWTGDPNLGPFLWSQRKGGDGMFARIEPVVGQRWYFESQNGALQVSTGGPFGTLVDAAGGWGSDRLSFIFPYEIYKGVPGGADDCAPTGCTHMIAGSYRVWETIQGAVPASSWYANSPDLTKGTLADRSFINQLAYAYNTDNIAIVGTNDGNVQYGLNMGTGVANSASWVNVTGGNTVLPNRPILDVTTDPVNPLQGYAAAGGFDQNTPSTPGHVFRVTCTANCASFTWENKTGNLPNIPVNAIATNPNYRQQVFAGTDWGVYYTNNIDAASPEWFRFNAGMPNVMIWDFAVDRGATTLAAFTRSRGAFVWPLPSAPFGPTATPTFTGTPLTNTPTSTPRLTNTPAIPPSYTPIGTSTFTPTPTHSPTATATSTPLGCDAARPLDEGFESGTLGSFTAVTVLGNSPWAVVSNTVNSGVYSAHVGDPNEQSDQRLEMTNAVAIPTAATEATFRFFHTYSFENPDVDFDGGVLEYSTDTGVTWLDAGPLITEGGYTGVITATAGNPLSGREAWTRVKPGYPGFSRVTVDLMSLRGQSVKLRFREGSDLNTGAPGWWVDDIYILLVGVGPTCTPTATPTATQVSATLRGHVNWQGRPAQPNSLQQLPVTLTLKLGANEVNYPSQTTDASGYFTVSVSTLPNGTYDWRVKGPKYLANAGSVALSGAPVTNQEMGTMRAGDCNNDNLVSIVDFGIMRASFGLSSGQTGYDDRADFTGDQVVNAQDFSLLRANFGTGGAPALRPGGR